MKKIIVRYKVKPESTEENKKLISKVFEELNSNAPDGLRYTSYVMADGVSFIHIASIETIDGTNPLNSSPSFKEFTKDLKDRCEEPPVATEVSVVGSYDI